MAFVFGGSSSLAHRRVIYGPWPARRALMRPSRWITACIYSLWPVTMRRTGGKEWLLVSLMLDSNWIQIRFKLDSNCYEQARLDFSVQV